MFVLVVTGKKELADDKAVLLGNPHHGLHLLKLEAGCILHCKTTCCSVSVHCFHYLIELMSNHIHVKRVACICLSKYHLKKKKKTFYEL